jgi:hypothetical protein
MTDRPVDLLINDALVALDALGNSGDGTARHAAAILRGQRRAGRPPIDDRAALAEVEQLTAAGRGREAVSIVARRLGRTPAEQIAIAVRLREKRRIKQRK